MVLVESDQTYSIISHFLPLTGWTILGIQPLDQPLVMPGSGGDAPRLGI